MKTLALAAVLTLVPWAPSHAQRACKGASSLVYRDSVSFLLDAPKGWILDCEAGRDDGPLTVLYRVGESWRDGQAVMYANLLSLEPGADSAIAKRIDAEVRDWKQRAGDAVVTREPSIRTEGGIAVSVRRFVSKAHGLHEIVAYIPRGHDMPVLAMTARSSQAFDKALPAFQALVRSYVVGPTVRAP
jgi:hypothetical protein